MIEGEKVKWSKIDINTEQLKTNKRCQYIKNCKNYKHKLFLCMFIGLSCIIFLYCFFLKKEEIKINKIIIKKNNKYVDDTNNTTELNLNLNYKFNLLNNLIGKNKEYNLIKNCLIKNPDEELCIYHLLAPKKLKGKELKLYGHRQDGGYILLNDISNIKVAYSFGIADDVSLEKEFADNNIDIYMYDHTINFLAMNHTRFHWKKKGLCGNNNTNATIYKTLNELLIENNHTNEKNMILKIDIEYNEWEVLKDLSENILKQFKYILIEFHFYLNHGKLYYDVLKKLKKTHQVFYMHCNDCESMTIFGNNRICKALEVSYIIKEGNIFYKDDTNYPIKEYDFTNCFLGRKPLDLNYNIFKVFDF
jgi:hypothetical protein